MQVPGHIGVDGAGNILQQYAEPHVKIWGGFALFDTTVEELIEILEGVLVHGVHVSQGGHYEVHHRASRGDLAVLLTCGSNLKLCLLSLCKSLRDLSRGKLFVEEKK